MNTSTTAAFLDVDAARIQWASTDNDSKPWKDAAILGLCCDARRILISETKSCAFKVGYAKGTLNLIEAAIKAKAS
jgi:hypothetical protein